MNSIIENLDGNVDPLYCPSVLLPSAILPIRPTATSALFSSLFCHAYAQ